MKAPWEHPKEGTPETGVRNVPTPEGRELGAEVARLAELERERFQAVFPEVPPMCADCACRGGTRANGCAPSVMSLLKCVFEVDEPDAGVFNCHLHDRICTGYLMLATAQAVAMKAAAEATA